MTTSMQEDTRAFADGPCYILVNTFPSNVNVAEHLPAGFVVKGALTIRNPNRADADASKLWQNTLGVILVSGVWADGSSNHLRNPDVKEKNILRCITQKM